MKRPFLQRLIASTVLIGAVLGTASVAQARPDVQVSIGLPGLPLLVPHAVYQAPAVAVYERPWQPSYRYETERERQWRHREWQRREWERRHQQWDRSSHRDHHGRD